MPHHCCPAATLDLIGTRMLRDADFYGNCDCTNTKELLRQDIGGRLQVYLRPRVAEAVTITGFTLGGKTFDQLTTYAIGCVDGTRWWRVWPSPVLSGEVAMLNIRLACVSTAARS